MTALDAPLTASDWTSTPLADVVIGADYAYRETIYPSDSVFASPRQTPRRVTAVEVADGYVTVVAKEPIHVLHNNLSPTGENQHSAKVGDAVMLRTIGPRWDSAFGEKVDAARARSKARRQALARVQREIPDGGDLWKVDVALEPLVAVLDERERLNRVVLDLQERLADKVWECDQALARVDDLEEEFVVLGQVDRAQALIERGFEPDDAEDRIEDARARYGEAS